MRKTLMIFLTAITLAGLFASCKKETTADVSKEVAVSFPTVELIGEDLIILPVGGTYTEQGAKLIDDISGEESTIQPTAGEVNTAVAGLYILTYSAANANGFEGVAYRRVAVTSVNNPIDRSGTYLRPATGVNCLVEKAGSGVYKVTNPGGAGVGTNTIVYYVETALNTFTCPPQPTDAGTFAVIEIVFTDSGSSWRVQNAGYGTGLRTFIKQ